MPRYGRIRTVPGRCHAVQTEVQAMADRCVSSELVAQRHPADGGTQNVRRRLTIHPPDSTAGLSLAKRTTSFENAAFCDPFEMATFSIGHFALRILEEKMAFAII
ncbi:hypothetical protein NDU88_004286 [Pleurodeles waltl]|uniref:Uncharacterized protein n=1 Tax=Pleurodeles waltl TaxID=8319 RepID=A0AAV7QFH0_PLEWA|nr:hypothetical protein NDU88_004286 [Pleurodeles waltl]